MSSWDLLGFCCCVHDENSAGTATVVDASPTSDVAPDAAPTFVEPAASKPPDVSLQASSEAVQDERPVENLSTLPEAGQALTRSGTLGLSPKAMQSMDWALGKAKDIDMLPKSRSRIELEKHAEQKSAGEDAVLNAEFDPTLTRTPSESSAASQMSTKKRLKKQGTASLGKNIREKSTRQGPPFPARPPGSKFSEQLWSKIEEVFYSIASSETRIISREDAISFFKQGFGKLSVDAMYREVDTDGNDYITSEEFIGFWSQVKTSGYKEADILEELELLGSGSAWVDFNDGRNTAGDVKKHYPKRPWFHTLSRTLWKKCEEVFSKIDVDGKLVLTHAKAEAFFGGGYGRISADAMFNEVDSDSWGTITVDEWISFWTQVRKHKYKEKDILVELDNICNGGMWVDWMDERTT